MIESKSLTVKDIKALLEKYPDDMPVMTHGFKEHYDPVSDPEVLSVKYNEENWDMFGKYEACEEGEKDSIEALVFFRDGRFS